MELYKLLVENLKNEPNYFDDEGNLQKWIVIQKIQEVDAELLTLLLKNEQLKATFFIDVEGVMVFNQKKLLVFLEQKAFLDDSYTRYNKKIGININGRYLTQNNDLELVWPYKDCILEGGQTEEEQSRNEIFFNQTLAQDEITQLKEPKVITNARRYTTKGIETNVTFSRNEYGVIKDNLIVKGNNLLALYSLEKEFGERIGLIYIDPPYYFRKTKPSDSFRYNSNFKLSSWLVFMRDRLTIAQKLLKPNGVILCHIKEDAIHWLKVLMEEVFGSDNFVETFIWKNTDNPDSLSKKSRAAVEYIVCFEKNNNASRKYIGKETENGDAPILHTGNNIHELVFPKESIHFNIEDGIYNEGTPDRVELVTPVIVENGLNKNEVILKGEFTWSQETLNEQWKNGCYFLVKSEKFSIRVQLPNGKYMAPEKYIDNQYLSKAIGVGTNEDANTHLKQLGIDFKYSKPESVVAFFIKAITEPNDIVLDFFLGSGTTAAVAHKMNRQYIGIDQMDYIETAAVERLQKVIGNGKEYDKGGVSQLKDVNWKGGGAFVYFELKKYNQRFIEQIEQAKNTDELLTILEDIKAKSFIDYNVDLKQLNNTIDEFKTLPIEDQRRVLCELLDKNQLYVNLSSLNDETFVCLEKEKQVTKEFYNLKE